MLYREAHLFPSGGEHNYRIPSLIATKDGTVLAFCTDRRNSLKDHADEIDLVYAVKRAGEDWSEVRTLAHESGLRCNIGSAVYDPAVDRVTVFFERSAAVHKEFGTYTPEELRELECRREQTLRLCKERGIVLGSRRLISDDGGRSFREEAHTVTPAMQTHWDGKRYPVGGSTHGSAHGICLRHGPYAGRLLCPSRTAIGEYRDWEKLRECVYNNAIYSDDHGKSWQASECVQVGTAEGTLIERADGSILYNSRAYFNDGKRYLAVSRDGGETYGDFSADDFLRESEHTGCNASFLRVEPDDLPQGVALPQGATGLTVFCNPRAQDRTRMTACVSFDDGAHFREARVLYEGPAAYSSLDYDRQSGHFFLLYEKGDPAHGSGPYTEGLCVAEFDLEWLLGDA